MAAYISFQPSDNFKTLLYTGTGSSNAITGVGFQPDWVWTKARTTTDSPVVCDSVRGATKVIYPSSTSVEATEAETLKTFDSDGYTVGTNSGYNTSSGTYVSWSWKAGTTSGLTGGTITPSSYSLNTTARQSIIAYTGTGSAATIPHGLGVVPNMIIVKALTETTDWAVYHTFNTSPPEDYIQVLNTYAVAADNNLAWNDTAPTSTLFSVNAGDTNASSKTHVAYCFASKKGYSKFGKYNGNGNFDGPFVYTGFRPAFVMIKTFTGSSEDWKIIDDKRSTYNVTAASLDANEADAEVTSYPICDFTSNGFKIRSNRDEYNGSTTRHYIYAAFAEFPLVSSNSKAGTAR